MSYIGNEPIVSATRTITEVTATAGQTVFTANGGYTVGYIDVFLNGAQLQTVDFTATNGTTITLTEAAQVGDVIRLVAWGTFSTATHVPLTGNSNITGNINVSGNLGVGTTSPSQKLDVAGRALFTNNGFNYVAVDSTLSDSYLRLASNTAVKWFIRNNVSNSHRLEITPDAGTSTGMFLTQAGDFQMNSGYGSVATAYGCRAWVNFNGTGTVAIRGSGNVSSITDNGAGNYAVNFTNAMPDANYCAVVSIEERGILCQTATADVFQQTAGVGRIGVTLGTSNTGFDAEQVNYSVFR